MVEKLSKWDNRMLLDAKMRASWSKDPSTRVGATLMRPDKTTAGHGFNGFAPGVDDSAVSDRAYKYQAIIHAEENAILDCRDPTTEGYTMYVWGLPCCGPCTARSIRKGVRRIVCVQERVRDDWESSFAASRTQALQAGVVIEVYRLDEIDSRLASIVFPDFSAEDDGAQS